MYFDYMMEKDQSVEAKEVTNFLKLPVYTRNGDYIGQVHNVFLDMDDKRVNSLLVTNTNPSYVDGSVDVAIPYRWVNAVGDIVILSYFPDKVTTKKQETEETEMDKSDIDVIE
jgi:sporulation protein YlmC with PRC-barrel domain